KRKLPNKIEFSALAAAALSEMMRRQRDAVGLTVFSDKIELHTPAKGNPAHRNFILHYLENLIRFDESKKNKTSGTAEMLHQLAEMIHKRALVIIFSDMFLSGNTQTDKDREEIF